MKTFNRICIKDHTITDKQGTSFTIEGGKEYLTSAVNGARAAHGPSAAEGMVTVFSKYWVSVPVDIFAGEQKFT